MTEHGIQAFYSNPGPERFPRQELEQTRVLFCSCGFSSATTTWEESGRLMDKHIREAVEAVAKERVSP